jgi:hypothetical protein
MRLTSEERRAKGVFDRAVRHWRRILLVDPIWRIRVGVAEDEDMGQGEANVDIGAAEYYRADISISRHLLSLREDRLDAMAANIACHELLHIVAADFHRAALVAAGDNRPMCDELRYRYEQFVSRFSMILLNLDSRLVKDCYEPIDGKDPGTPGGMPQVQEMPAGDEDGGGA